jgi:hypothetical protein
MSTNDRPGAGQGPGPEEPRYGRRAEPGEQAGATPPPPPAYPGGGYGSTGASSPYTTPPSAPPSGPPSYGSQPPYGPSSYSTQESGYGQGTYGQGSYDQRSYGSPQGPRPRRTGPIVMIVVGALLMILGPIIGIVAAASAGMDTFNEIANDGATVENGGTVSLPAGVDRVVYSESGEVSSFSCDIVDPAGQAVSTRGAEGDGQDVDGGTIVPGVAFTTTEAGSYTVDCGLPAEASQTLLVAPPLDFGGLLGAGVAVLVGLGAGFLGLVLLIIGIVWLVRRNKKIRTGQY